MRAINLLPRDEQRVRLEGARTPFLVAAGGIVVVTVVAALLTLSASGTIEDRESQLADIESAMAHLPEPPETAISFGMLARERSDRIEALAAALSTRVAFDRVLQEISYVFPEDAWLTRFEASAPEAAAPAIGAPPPQAQPAASVTIQGATYTHEALARVLGRLTLVPSLENVVLTSSSRVEPQEEISGAGQPTTAEPARTGKPFVAFVVSASLRTGAAG